MNSENAFSFKDIFFHDFTLAMIELIQKFRGGIGKGLLQLFWKFHIRNITHDVYMSFFFFRIPTRKYEFFLVLIFATDEINRNPYILPNMSLIFDFVGVMCFDTLNIIDLLYSPKNSFSSLSNYDCGTHVCIVELTGPSWTTSVKLTTYTMNTEVRLCGKGRGNSLSRTIPSFYWEWMVSMCLCVLMYIF